MFDLTGRKALVTGASGGIGEAIAAHAARAGRDRRPARHARREAGGAGRRARRSRQAVSRPTCPSRDEVKALGQKAEAELGASTSSSTMPASPRTACSCACRTPTGTRCIEVNLTAVFRLTRELTHPMMRRRFGRIINITSVVGVTGNPGQANYCASKAGMIGFSKSLAQEIATRNVTVNCVAPGFIESAMTDKLNDKQKEAIMARHSRRSAWAPAPKSPRPSPILASNEAGYVTGQTIHVNGGMAMI